MIDIITTTREDRIENHIVVRKIKLSKANYNKKIFNENLSRPKEFIGIELKNAITPKTKHQVHQNRFRENSKSKTNL